MVSKVNNAGVVMPKRTKKAATFSMEASCDAVILRGSTVDTGCCSSEFNRILSGWDSERSGAHRL
jgi:hypothetical protein